MKETLITLFLGFTFLSLRAQHDTSHHKVLHRIDIDQSPASSDIQRLDSVQGTWIFEGKKTEVIRLSQKDVPLAEKYGRQVFAKIPGVFVYDMDGTGNQTSISTRGLDPHRGWEFNIRKDGILTNSDMYGYPASHYNMPMEAVDRIELVRGTGSLQYGAQFGGMLNYISKQPDSSRAFAFENQTSVGSYGLVSTFFRGSGTIGKLSYNIWAANKSLSGYRQNSESHYDAQNISIFYRPLKSLLLKLEYTHSNYTIQLAGPLTDAMFHLNPQMATRARNYYNPDIYVPNFTLDWNYGKAGRLLLTSAAVLGWRNSVMFDKPATIADSIVTATGQYNNRQVDIDQFHSYTTELRLLQGWAHNRHQLAAGVQYLHNNLHRQQLGKGSTGSDFDIHLVSPGWGRDLHYQTQNIALFAENRWSVSKRLSLTTGIRMESGTTNMNGTIVYYSATQVPNQIRHSFPLAGANFRYRINQQTNIYGGWSQAYRPVIFKDIIPAAVYEVTDKHLKDAWGYNAEVGCRGRYKWLQWDITAYQLQYNNRLGSIATKDSIGNNIIFRTNIGNSLTRGVEAFVQGSWRLGKTMLLTVFSSTAYTNALYQKAVVRNGNENKDVSGNHVESTPQWISRNGLTLKAGRFSVSILYSYTASSFADALNSVSPNATGASGLVPSYGLLDASISWSLSRLFKLQVNGSNLCNVHYFTKRPQFYPGPGIWPSDGRTMSVSVSMML